MYYRELRISRVIGGLGHPIFKLYDFIMCELYTKPVNFLELCRHFSNGLVTSERDIFRPCPVPGFPGLEVIASGMAAESEEIGSRNWSFWPKPEGCRASMTGLLSHRQSDGRRKASGSSCEQVRVRMAKGMDGGEDYSCPDSKPAGRVACGKQPIGRIKSALS